MTSPNHELFVKVLAQIEREPQRWAQAAYAKEVDCGTAYCFAGWAVHLSGYQVVIGESVEDEAVEVLGLTRSLICPGGPLNFPELFAPDNTLDDLYRLSADLLGIDETVLRDKVAAEVSA